MASSSRSKSKGKALPQGQKRTSGFLDPEEELRAYQSTTEVELLNLSTDGRSRRIRTKVDVVPTAPRPLAVPLFDLPYDNSEDPNYIPPPDTSVDTGGFDWTETFLLPPPEIPGVQVKSTQRNKRYLNSDAPLITWLKYRQDYLDELMRREGRGFNCGRKICQKCGEERKLFRCKDCTGGGMYCGECTVAAHAMLPLHIVEEWTGSYFQKVRLAALGLRVQLSHDVGHPCSSPCVGHKDFIVLHTNGIHQVSVDFCGCHLNPDHWRQLLRFGWYPATPINPQTCATFEVLRLFQTMNLQGKIAAYDFYQGLLRLTDGYGIEPLPDRQPSFMFMVQEWRNLLLLKRAGRGFHSSGVAGTKQGELAVRCRACPIPGENIPADFQSASKDDAWLYRVMLAQDANFRLKGRLRKTEVADISLTNGLAYFVEDSAYKAYLASAGDGGGEISNCVTFHAIANANAKGAKSLANTGVAGVCCGRHESVRPNGLGDLQKGERYANIDYIFLASIIGIAILTLVSSYDIGCQWSINFWSRIAAMPSYLELPTTLINILFVVPAFHLEAHIERCKPYFSPRYLRGLAQTEFEAIERLWAILNGAAASTKEMRPGHRRDTLDDFCGYANWTKVTRLGASLLRKMVVAIPSCITHRRALQGFEDNIREASPETLDSWIRMFEAWQDSEDRGKDCPFVAPRQELSVGDVRLQLAEEEQTRGVSAVLGREESGEAAFIVLGMELEVAQAQLQVDLAGYSKATALQRADLEDRRGLLYRRIQRLRDSQGHLMPDLRLKLELSEEAFKGRRNSAESIPLRLPSSLTPTIRSQICSATLVDAECRLREAEAFDALEGLRNRLRTKTFMGRFKTANITGQRSNTRARALLAGVDLRIFLLKHRYRRARAALMNLVGAEVWRERGLDTKLQELKDEDVRGLSDSVVKEAEKASVEFAQQQAAAGIHTLQTTRTLKDHPEGSRTLSWIWLSVPLKPDGTDPGFNDALRVEWAKAKARAERWTEEVRLVYEEMRRSIESCRFQSNRWKSLATSRHDISPELADGLAAYAFEHADLEERLARDMERRWAVIRQRAKEFIDSGFTTDEADAAKEAELPDQPAQPLETVTLNLRELDLLDDSDDDD